MKTLDDRYLKIDSLMVLGATNARSINFSTSLMVGLIAVSTSLVATLI